MVLKCCAGEVIGFEKSKSGLSKLLQAVNQSEIRHSSCIRLLLNRIKLVGRRRAKVDFLRSSLVLKFRYGATEVRMRRFLGGR